MEAHLDLLIDALEDARHRAHDGGMHVGKIVFNMLHGARESHGGAGGNAHVVRDRSLKGVRKGQERKVDVFFGDCCRKQNLLDV